jgi:glycosyltransferase involved in cell wall biosynthesis
MGECGRARAVAEFSWRAVAVGYLRLFEDEFEKLKTAQRI